MLRREAWTVARGQWLRLLAFVIVWATLTTALAAVQQTDFVRGVFVGLMVGLLGLFLMTFLVATGIAQRQMGGSAEQWTAEVFEPLAREGWYVAHDVAFERTNVDHVLVGPGRIYAVETKWTSSHEEVEFQRRARTAAQRGARKVRLLLTSHKIEADVTPLLVVWGPGTDQMQGEVKWTEGVGIVAGVHAEVWLKGLRSSSLGLTRDAGAQRAIADFIQTRDVHEHKA